MTTKIKIRSMNTKGVVPKKVSPMMCTRTRMANWALKCPIIILIIARSSYSYNNILINFGQLYSNSCYTSFSIATLGMCIACEFHQLWAVRPCIYHKFWHLTKRFIFCRIGHAGTLMGELDTTCNDCLKISLVFLNTHHIYNLMFSVFEHSP